MVYLYDANHELIDSLEVDRYNYYDLFFSPEPRIAVTFKADGIHTVKASYTRSTQFLQILSNASGPFTSLEIWAPAGPNIRPLLADQVTLGYLVKLFSSRVAVSAEGFYKQFRNHVDYTDHANLLYNPYFEGEIRQGDAWSYGLEMMARKSEGKLTGWIGYTWSRAFVRTPEVNDGKTYPAGFDSPHNLCVFVSYDTWKRWTLSATWIYLTGNPITTPSGFYTYEGTSVPVYGEKNNDRLPDYHRLDLSVTCRLNKPDRKFQHSLILTLYNAYGRSNPFSVSFNKYKNDRGEFVVPSDTDQGYDLVPTTISVAGVIPSINYQFRF
jgi:hypothetical protein